MSSAMAMRARFAEIRPVSPERIQQAIRKLKSLHNGDAGVIETIGSGIGAIPALREILFEREPSGLYETRRRAVEALAGLQAYDVLREFLGSPHDINDPVEQTGEEAVTNAAARALGNIGNKRDLPLLLLLLKRKPLAGVIDAVARFRRAEALPYLVEALADDFTRQAAEDAIRALGIRARHVLLECALLREPHGGHEASSSRSRRRSALRLLLEIGVPEKFTWPALHDLMEDPDPWIAVLSARISLRSAMKEEKPEAIRRLIELLKTPDSVLVAEIEDCLTLHFCVASSAIKVAIELKLTEDDPGAPWWLRDKALTALLRVRERAEAKSSGNGDE